VELQKVRSSAIDAIGYDDSTGTLVVRFKDGGTYEYSDVPKTRYVELMTASSLGSYFDRFIRKGGYRWRKIA
jgi:hypothetical protein